MKRFLIFEKQVLSLQNDDDEDPFAKHFVAINEEHTKNGIFVLGRNPDLSKEPVGSIEARDAEQAVTLFKEKRKEGVY